MQLPLVGLYDFESAIEKVDFGEPITYLYSNLRYHNILTFKKDGSELEVSVVKEQRHFLADYFVRLIVVLLLGYSLRLLLVHEHK